jgi:hypothetical protein
MPKTDLVRNSLREGLKAKGRSRRQSAVRRAEAANGSRQIRNDLLPALKIESYLIDALGSHSRRLRKSDAAHIREIANSIGALGFNVPLLIGQDNMVIDGELRLAAARQLGLASVPCIRVDHLNESEQRLLRLAVNRLGEKGSWDIAELEAEFKELIIAEAPIELSGFGSDEKSGAKTKTPRLAISNPAPAPRRSLGSMIFFGSGLIASSAATLLILGSSRGSCSRMLRV